MDVFLNRRYKPMLIGRETAPFDDESYVFELKLDGVRTLAYVSDHDTTLLSRNGLTIGTQFPEISTLHEHVTGTCILDGELIALRNGVPFFEDIKKRVLSRQQRKYPLTTDGPSATFVVFDMLYQNGTELIRRPFHERRKHLEATVQETDHIALSRLINSKGIAFFNEVKMRGLEGIIGKRLDSLYHPGKRTNDWVKCKNLLDDDFIVCGYIHNKNNTVSLILGQYDVTHQLVYKGRVMLGRAQNDFAIIQSLPKAKHPPSFTKSPPHNNDNAIWVKLMLVCRVTFLSQTENGLRHPVYYGLRIDKDPEEVSVRA